MNKKLIFIMVLTLMALNGCTAVTSRTNSVQDMGNPLSEEVFNQKDYGQIMEPEDQASLWTAISAENLFQDMRAHRVGDLVTVNIVETSSASKKAGTSSSRSSSIDGSISNALGWENRIKNLTSFGKDDVSGAFDNSSMLKASLTNSFDGSGSTSRDESMTASITARVTEVRPNGNLFIKGTREIKVNNESQYIILSGLIRPTDISPDNTVLSSYIGDARIEYVGKGPVSDKQRPGWLTRAVDFVWPF